MKARLHDSKETAGISAGGRGARRSSRRGMALLVLAAGASAQAAEFTHDATLTFCALTAKVHATCTDRVRDGHNIVALDVDCKLTRDIAGGGSYAMAETRRRVDAADESLEVTQFDAPHRFKARYCAVNRGLYLQGAIFGPSVIRFPPQPEDQACANRAPSTPGVDQ